MTVDQIFETIEEHQLRLALEDELEGTIDGLWIDPIGGSDREGDLDLTVVVPSYNPGEKLRSTIQGLIGTLSTTGLHYEIIAVSDGSTDGSAASLVDLPSRIVRSVPLQVNQGKGNALRVGLGLGRGRLLAFIDADGDLPPGQMAQAVAMAQAEDPDIVLGSKRHPDSKVHTSRLRRLYSAVWQKLVSASFRLDVGDTQTGLKVMRRDVVLDALPLMVEKGFAFDLELLVIARRLGYDRFMEMPVEIVERTVSTVSMRTALTMLRQAAAIFVRRYLRGSYRGARTARDRFPVEESPTLLTRHLSIASPQFRMAEHEKTTHDAA